jgi:hypothetical protein
MAQRRTLLQLKEEIHKQKMRIFEIEQDIATHRYLDTMPYSPTYKYCFATSNFGLTSEQQDIDAWLRAIILHMAGRRTGHGGAYTEAMILSRPDVPNENIKELWITHHSAKMRKFIKVRKPKPTDSS